MIPLLGYVTADNLAISTHCPGSNICINWECIYSSLLLHTTRYQNVNTAAPKISVQNRRMQFTEEMQMMISKCKKKTAVKIKLNAK